MHKSLFVRQPQTLAAAKEEYHGYIIRAGYKPVGPITAQWQACLFQEGQDALVFSKVTRK